MVHRITNRAVWVGVFTILVMFLAACGPARPAADSGVGSGSGADASDLPGSEAFEGETAVARDRSEIPMGFTPEGYAYIGHLDAPVLIEEFSDFQCPFCARFHTQTFPSLVENQIANGEVLFIYRDFPLSSHPQAFAAANAARCAGEQSPALYWAMHDRLFQDIGQWSNANANTIFASYGEEIGVDAAPFVDCLSGERYLDQARADLNEGLARGVTSTPSFFINEQPLVGAQPLTVFNQAIAAVMAGESIASNQPPAAPDPNLPVIAPTPVVPQPQAAATLGSPNAPITIVEFSDYQCPFCRRHALETMPFIKAQLIDSGRVQYVFKDLPLDSIHPEARQAAVAARCAGEQDAYWEMHDALFTTQTRWGGSGAGLNGLLSDIAADLGLNQSAFDSCLTSGRHDAAVQENYAEAASLGIQGTPYFLIDGYPLSGALPADVFEFAVGLAEEGGLGQAIAEAAAEQRRQQQQQQQQQQQPPPQQDVPIGSAHMIGDPNAPITVIEYTDFQCPFCQRHSQETLPLIIQNYVETGLVRYAFKDFPIVNNHPQAVKAAEAARCAGEQGEFLAMHDLIFDEMQQWSGRADAANLFISYANQLGLASTDFSQCLNSGKYEAAVMADLNEGASFGVSGTPAFFINGYLVAGAYPYDTFAQIFESLLDELGR